MVHSHKFDDNVPAKGKMIRDFDTGETCIGQELRALGELTRVAYNVRVVPRDSINM